MTFKKMLAFSLAVLLVCGGLTGCAQRYGDLVEYTLPWGTPIVGGLEVVYGVDGTDPEQCRAVKDAFENRLNALGEKDYTVSCNVAEMTVTVNLTGAEQDCMTVAKKLTQFGQIEFRMGDDTDDDGNPTGKLILDGNDIQSAVADHQPANEDGTEYQHVVVLKLNDSGKSAFAKATKEQAACGGTISIWLDYGENYALENNASRYQMVSNPTVSEEITTGEATITGSANAQEAKVLASMIGDGSLPTTVFIRDHLTTTTPLLEFVEWLYGE